MLNIYQDLKGIQKASGRKMNAIVIVIYSQITFLYISFYISLYDYQYFTVYGVSQIFIQN